MAETQTNVGQEALARRHDAGLPFAERRNILGIDVLVLDRQTAIDRIGIAVRNMVHTRIAFLNANGANLVANNERYEMALNRFDVLADGIGVDTASRILYGTAFPTNLNGTDFLPKMLESLDGPLKIGLFGAAPGVATRAMDELARFAPQHFYRTLGDGYCGTEEQARILAKLARQPVDILLVALGNPRQELWITDHITVAHATVPIGVGAFFDFVAGEVARAPQWVIDMRAEWLFRLVQEPGRLWRRYVLGNPAFLARVCVQKLFR